MAIMNVNPTRMELTRLKRRLVVARRGHKLLKDKRDELMKKFIEMVKKNREQREKAEGMIKNVHLHFLTARSVMPPEILDEALMLPKQTFSLDVAYENIMSVKVPAFNFRSKSDKAEDIFTYGFSDTSGELDDAVANLYKAIPCLFELAQTEKTVELLADEIEKTRRRVNALEYILIPQLTDTIKYIKMKLDENERGNLTRLMKVKDMMIENSRKAVKFIIPILITSLIISGCSIFGKKDKVLVSPLEKPPPIKYSTIEVKKGDIRKEIKDTVSIEVSAGTSIYSKYGGRLKGFYVKNGDIINKGDLLAEFETDSAEAKLKQYEIALEKAKKNREQAIAQVERDIELAGVRLEELKNDLKEKEALRELVLLEGSSALKSYEKDINDINNSIMKQEEEIDVLYEKLEAAEITGEMDVKNAEHNLNRARKELESMKVISDVEGIALNVGRFTLGEQVGAYTRMLTIIKPEDVQLKYAGSNARYFEVGMKVEINIDNTKLEGEVAVSPAYLPKDAPGTNKEAIIINIKGLTTELMANRERDIWINLVLDERNDVIVVPKRVLQNYKGNKFVYVLKDGDKQQRFVEIGLETNTEAEITKGLEVGDLIIEA